MNLVFVTEARFLNKNGNVYGDAAFEYAIWQRYLKVFDEIFIVARVDQQDDDFNKKYKSSGDKVHFIDMPYYIGPLQYLLKYFQIHNQVKRLVKTHWNAAFICRVPGNMGDIVIKELKRKSKAYGIEVVGDPDEVFSDESFKHPLKKFFHKNTIRNLKRNISGAAAVLYVTKYTLQRKYPVFSDSFTTYASNVMLSSDFSAKEPKTLTKAKVYKVLSAGSLEQMYKAPDIALEAVKIYNSKFPEQPIEFNWLGDGIYMENLQKQCADMKLNNFHFKGQVSSKQVVDEMKKCDLFVLVSRTEGLPRVIIEAMAQGLPVIGTKVGGIPELLNEDSLIEKNNAEALALKINEILSRPDYYTKLSARNLKEACEYDASLLSSRREEFYQTLKAQD
ncbi:glycosyltransferase [Chryseobacterium indoltheticum]|uniref:Spore coat protein SA n=1 Tax=Chryseobacterium indoltheticum TaxID=254 RepID=A0A381FQF6_9FLAO|nr:glycosyltransferase [Chryseobacterium indoltheticum]SUX48412.1 Spore coat protein SA [Chryseobacterium indoltheticum]